MEAQVKRCKTIVSGILMSAGEARGESSSQTTVRQFLDTWCRTGAPRARWTPSSTTTCWRRQPHGGRCHPGANGFNVLDNAGMHRRTGCACRRSAMPMRCESWSPTGAPAFRPPCSATSARPTSPPRAAGGGLGLFLSMNVARTLGGSVVARNRPEGGARSHHHAFAGCHHPARHRLGRPWTLTACC